MTIPTSKHALENLLRFGIGFDPHFFERNAESPNFPPHNIVQLTSDQFRLTMAVAGFLPTELEIVLEGDILTVSGHKAEEPETEGQILYRGIAFRDFARQFKVGENVHVQQASLDHGLLNITLVRVIPESRRPKLIQITA